MRLECEVSASRKRSSFFFRGGHTSGKFQLPKLQQNPADFDVLHEFGVVVLFD